jgi:hypothetical protein
MTREFLEEILDKMKADFPQFKKVAIYNNQFDNNDTGTIDSFAWPACFVSIPDEVVYSGYGNKIQKTEEFTLRFYIAIKTLTDKNILDVFDLKQLVFSKFHGYQPQNATSLNRSKETCDESRTNYYIFIQDYLVKLVDSSNSYGVDMVSAGIVTAKVDVDLEINPVSIDGVRTR